jgi:N-acetyl sugar amidotransferase
MLTERDLKQHAKAGNSSESAVDAKIRYSLDRQLASQPKTVRYCTNCVVSNQRPRLEFDSEGVCTACLFAREKANRIDWTMRTQELERLCDKYRRNDGAYDVVVPCSGGKDSSSVAHKLKHKYGMHPLTVTWAPFAYTDIGFQNFQSFVKAGFTNLLCWPNGHLHRKLSRIAFEAVGDAWQPFTFGQMCYAFHIALLHKIKLVFFGENGEAEYGGSTKNNYRPFMPLEDWSDLYFKGVTVDDMIAWGHEHNLIASSDYDQSDLQFYKPPTPEALTNEGIQMHWFSYYERWIPQENYYYCAENTGFQANRDGRSEGTYSKYASLDDRLDGFHYYLAYLKFGIARATSDAAHEVRDGHITREEAVALVHRFDGEFPKQYFPDFLEYLGIDEAEFWRIADTYRAPHLWEKVDGIWKLKVRVS